MKLFEACDQLWFTFVTAIASTLNEGNNYARFQHRNVDHHVMNAPTQRTLFPTATHTTVGYAKVD